MYDESEYDLFNVGHAGTAIATATGMARGYAIERSDQRVVAVVGDASIFNGVAFEGLNQAGTLSRQLLVVLNDNSMGIAPTQGGMAKHLAKFRVSRTYEELKKRVKKYLPQVPLVGRATFDALDHLKEGLKATVSPHQIFEQLGFIYVGPMDGHDVGHLVELLEGLKDVNQPVLLHVHTEKGRGADFAEAEPTRFHSPKPFKVEGCRVEIESSGRNYTAAFADAMIRLAKEDDRIYALTAAMPDGTGLNLFQKAYPNRFLDGGIAESGTVDIAAGMCKAGQRPVVAIYSTFLQRAFDQIFQEVVLQGLPVVFAMDRAGLVGGDGPVHHGFLDIAFLRAMPNMVLMAPGDGEEMIEALRLALRLNLPSALRYPRDAVPEPLMGEVPTPAFEVGQALRLRNGSDATILAYGAPLPGGARCGRSARRRWNRDERGECPLRQADRSRDGLGRPDARRTGHHRRGALDLGGVRLGGAGDGTRVGPRHEPGGPAGYARGPVYRPRIAIGSACGVRDRRAGHRRGGAGGAVRSGGDIGPIDLGSRAGVIQAAFARRDSDRRVSSHCGSLGRTACLPVTMRS